MVTRFEIRATVPDARDGIFLHKLRTEGYPVTSVAIVDVYSMTKRYTPHELEKIRAMLANPLTQAAYIESRYTPAHAKWVIEIGYLPGVTDNVATTTKEMIADGLGKPFAAGEGVYTSIVYFLSGKIDRRQVSQIADDLYNPLIQRAIVRSSGEFTDPVPVPEVKLSSTFDVRQVDLAVSDEELTKIGKLGIANADNTRRGPLALDLSYMKAIQHYFSSHNRKPTDIELESLAQTWSEHCKHTIFNDPIDAIKKGLFATYIKGATDRIRRSKGKNDICVSVFRDNSGGIVFDDTYVITHKVETHNSPSALDPFGGAITGIVGVNRDAIGFGLGAKPVANTFGYCVGNPRDTEPLYRGKDKTQKMLSPRRILDGIVAGVNAGGNCSGIPTPLGFLYTDDRYKGKPLVFVGTVGLIPKKHNKQLLYQKRARPGDYIVMVGGRVGLDGIHGATFSSEAMDAGSPATAVQIGDPITQKKLSDAIVKEARDQELFTSITDNGAGGLSCSVAEMAKESGGCDVRLEKVPLKYPGLAPWQIWISESQERMTLAVPKNSWTRFWRLMKRRGVEATIIGTFTHSGKCVVSWRRKTIMDIPLTFLHDGLPVRARTSSYHPLKLREDKRPDLSNYTDTVVEMLEKPNLASFEYITMQYDHEVQATSVLKPLAGRGRVNVDAAVLRPVLSSAKGVVLSQALYPSYSELDPYAMAAASIDTAIRMAVAAGADIDHLALLDNFCWCSANDPTRLGQLKEAARACYDVAVAYGTPFISGKDSMFNDFHGFDKNGHAVTISIPPTLLITAIGVIPDVSKVVSLDAKFPGDAIYVIGDTHDELGGSEYFSLLRDTHRIATLNGPVPRVDMKKNIRFYKTFRTCVAKGLIASAASVHRGGLVLALVRTAMAGRLGIEADFGAMGSTVQKMDSLLFSESQGRFIVTVAPKNRQAFERTMKGLSWTRVGTITDDSRFRILNGAHREIVNCSVDTLIGAYRKPFMDY